MNEKYKNCLKKAIEACCENGKLVIEPFADECLNTEIIFKAFMRAKKYGDNFAETLENEACSDLIDPQCLFSFIYYEIDKMNDTELNATVRSDDNLFEHLCQAGFKGFSYNFDKLIDQTKVFFTITLGTNEEQNLDSSSIVSAYGSWKAPAVEDMNEKTFDNALTHLIHQQGHSVEEVFNCLAVYPGGFDSDDGNFIKSVVNEIANNTSDALSELILLIKLKGQEIIDFFETILKNDSYIKISAESKPVIGLFNSSDGCGSLLDIKLEKDLIFSPNLMSNVHMHNSHKSPVSEVYGLSDDSWTEDALGYTEEEPVLYEENKNIYNRLKKIVTDFKNDDSEIKPCPENKPDFIVMKCTDNQMSLVGRYKNEEDAMASMSRDALREITTEDNIPDYTVQIIKKEIDKIINKTDASDKRGVSIISPKTGNEINWEVFKIGAAK